MEQMKELKSILEYFAIYGLNQNDLARICNTNPGQMRHYTSGVRTPSLKTIEKIRDKVRIFAEELKKFA